MPRTPCAGDRTRLAADLTALNVLALGATQQQADVLARLALVEQLAEHLDAGDRRLLRLAWANADDLDLLVHLDHATLDTTRDNGAATGDREDILDRHQERHVDLALRSGDVLINRTLSSMIASAHFSSPWRAGKAATRTTGTSSPGNS